MDSFVDCFKEYAVLHNLEKHLDFVSTFHLSLTCKPLYQICRTKCIRSKRLSVWDREMIKLIMIPEIDFTIQPHLINKYYQVSYYRLCVSPFLDQSTQKVYLHITSIENSEYQKNIYVAKVAHRFIGCDFLVKHIPAILSKINQNQILLISSEWVVKEYAGSLYRYHTIIDITDLKNPTLQFLPSQQSLRQIMKIDPNLNLKWKDFNYIEYKTVLGESYYEEERCLIYHDRHGGKHRFNLEEFKNQNMDISCFFNSTTILTRHFQTGNYSVYDVTKKQIIWEPVIDSKMINRTNLFWIINNQLVLIWFLYEKNNVLHFYNIDKKQYEKIEIGLQPSFLYWSRSRRLGICRILKIVKNVKNSSE